MIKRRILGLIPARGGSKGIKMKNLYPFKKKPLIQWTIESALKSNSLEKIIVSTDDINIANFSKDHGVDVPFLRDSKLAKDDSLIVDTVLSIIDQFNDFDDVLLLQPTSPLRTNIDIKNIINLKEKYNAESLVSVCETKENPALFFQINNQNYLRKSFIELKGSNRQNLKKFYTLNGALYLSSINHLRKYNDFLSINSMPYIMPLERSIDIDELLDVKWGEFISEYNNKP